MKINNITEVELQIIINNTLYKNKIIDEYTYIKTDEQLLKRLNNLKNNK